MSDLPPHVYAVKDRHGKVRHRFIRRGWRSRYLPGAAGSADFHRAYSDVLEAGPRPPVGAVSPRPVVPRSIDDLIARMKRTPRWKRKKDRTRHVQARLLERFVNRTDAKGRRYGDRPVDRVTVGWLDNILGEMAHTPAAANTLRKRLAELLDHAIRIGWRDDNPARLTESYGEGDGYHTWTDAEMAQYRAHHQLGTMARLTLELAFNTAARKCNVAALTREDIRDGRIHVAHVKGNHDTSVPMLATTKAALDALPAAPLRHLVVTTFGKPFTVNGLGNKMRQWCDDAGLPHCSMHGIRKATSRQLAERGSTDAEGQAVTGHKKAETFARYRARANRTALADRAVSNLGPLADFQPSKKDGNTDD